MYVRICTYESIYVCKHVYVCMMHISIYMHLYGAF